MPAGMPAAGDGPVKRSVMIAGHATSVTLEPVFWEALRAAAAEEILPLSALVARIDAARVEQGGGVNLASALRIWLFRRALARAGQTMENGESADQISASKHC